jgi:thermostable 8-oxoguanine DNA glycosylase
MFGLFKKKSKLQILQKKYDDLMKDYHRISKINRREADKKFVEAEAVLKEIDEALNEQEANK